MESDAEGSRLLPGLPAEAERTSHVGEPVPDADRLAGQQARAAAEMAQEVASLAGEPAGHPWGAPVTIAETLERLAASAERCHARAEQRERVIGHLHAEVDRLRQGERRGLLRPLLVEVCRLRSDLLRQAEGLPNDFDADRARLLLRSYADSIELALEDNGVAAYAPAPGDRFEPRLHRRVGGEPAGDPEHAGRIARVRRSGYLDLDTNMPMAPAEVVLFTPASTASPPSPAPPGERGGHGEFGSDSHESADAADERKQP